MHTSTPFDEKSPPPIGAVDFALLGIVVIWGANFAVLKASIDQIQPLVFTAMRFAVGAIVLLILIAASGIRVKVECGDWGRLMRLALLGHILFQAVFVMGMARTTASHSALIIGASPIFVAAISHFLGKEHLLPLGWMGVTISFGGIALIIFGKNNAWEFKSQTLAGDLLTLLASNLWAAYTLMVRPAVSKMAPLVVTTFTVSLGALGLSLVAIPSFLTQNWSAIPPMGWAGVAFSGPLVIGVGYFVWGLGVKRLGSSRTSAYSNLITVAALAAAVLFLGEHLLSIHILGAMCVFLGVALTRRAGATGIASRRTKPHARLH